MIVDKTFNSMQELSLFNYRNDIKIISIIPFNCHDLNKPFDDGKGNLFYETSEKFRVFYDDKQPKKL